MQCLVRALFLVCRQLSSPGILMWQRARKPVLVSLFTGALNPFTWAPPSQPNFFLKALPPITINLGVRVSTYEFVGTQTFGP